MTYKILLALPSPLYAPLYLAKQMRLNAIFRDIDFEYRTTRGKGDTPERGDPLVRDVLNRYKHHDCIAAVGDPFRGLIKDELGFDQPYVPLGLVQNMFYWFMDHRTAVLTSERKDFYKKFWRLLVHPPHMTGYAVACHDLMKTCNISTLQEAANHLYSDTVVPGREVWAYNRFRDSKVSSRDCAFLTMNIFEVFNQHLNHEMKIEYARDPQFQNCIMTGLIVSREKYEKKDPALIALEDGIKEALHKINTHPNEALGDLRGYRDEQISFGEDVPRDILARSFQYLIDNGAFPVDGRITRDHVTRSHDIRETSRKLNPYDRHLMDDINQITDSFKLTAPVVAVESRPPNITESEIAAVPVIRIQWRWLAAVLVAATPIVLPSLILRIHPAFQIVADDFSALMLGLAIAGAIVGLLFMLPEIVMAGRRQRVGLIASTVIASIAVLSAWQGIKFTTPTTPLDGGPTPEPNYVLKDLIIALLAVVVVWWFNHNIRENFHHVWRAVKGKGAFPIVAYGSLHHPCAGR